MQGSERDLGDDHHTENQELVEHASADPARVELRQVGDRGRARVARGRSGQDGGADRRRWLSRRRIAHAGSIGLRSEALERSAALPIANSRLVTTRPEALEALHDEQTGVLVDAFSAGLDIIAAGLAVAFILRITSAQSRNAERTGLPLGSFPRAEPAAAAELGGSQGPPGWDRQW
jgi:hypothetical protein